MNLSNVCVIGGGGFVGGHVVHLLAARQVSVRVPTRRRERSKPLIVLPTVDVIECDVHDSATLKNLVTGCDAVINLVGVLHDGSGTRSFRQAHVELTRKVVDACRRAGVPRLLHMSALNADPRGPSEYLQTKGEAERLVRESGLDWTIFRPSVIFGLGDSFLSVFACLQRMLPVLALACPNARFQPVYVEDVARAFLHALDNPDTIGESYDLCGPRVYTLRELVRYTGELTGHRRPILPLTEGLSYLQAFMMELMPVKLMSRDNVRSMKVDSVCGCAFPQSFGFAPTPLESVAPAYLADVVPRARYRGFRFSARR